MPESIFQEARIALPLPGVDRVRGKHYHNHRSPATGVAAPGCEPGGQGSERHRAIGTATVAPLMVGRFGR